LVKWGVAVAILVVLAVFEFSMERWDFSAICPKCLQHAYILERRVLGITFWRKVRESQSHAGLMNSATFSPGIPGGNPKVYEQIHGGQCRHEFKNGGFGRSTGLFLGGLHADGSSMQWSFYTPRIRAIEALYAAFGKAGDEQLAQRCYRLIDATYPMDDKSKAVAVWCGVRSLRFPEISDAEIENEIQKLEQYDAKVRTSHPEYVSAPTARKLVELRRMTARLDEVGTPDEFRDLVDEYSERLLGTDDGQEGR